MRDDPLTIQLRAELGRPVVAAVSAFGAQLAERGHGCVAAVLYYGSTLRDGSLEGILDFYVIVDSLSRWPQSWMASCAGRVLPPNVGYLESEVDGRKLRAKYAVIALDQFCRGMSADSIDTTLWARFSQPSVCIYTRTLQDGESVVEAVRQATVTASRWAAALGPDKADATGYWRQIYSLTYGAELRVETGARGVDLVGHEPERYLRVLPLAWQACGIDFERLEDGVLSPRLSFRTRRAALRRWTWIRRAGKVLNLLRLVKAAFTFDGATDYVAGKVERQTGISIEISPWQRRHPLLAAPGLYIRLRRRGLLR